MTHDSTRREFIKQSAVGAGAAWWVGTQSLAAQEKSSVERLNFACIGVGGKGSSDTDSAGRHGNVVALCDIDTKRLAQKARAFPKAKTYTDYRQMLEEIGEEIDGVTVSTPDHTHAPAGLKAMRMGKHCFCQKPLTWSVEEARMMREVAKAKGVATQMGNQGTATDGLRTSVEIVRSGGIGDVTECHIWTNRPIWPQGTGRPEGEDPVPESLNWDLFLGAAPERPYKNNTYHPFKWRGWLDFGTGALGDMACHTANMAVMALDMFDPISIEAETSGIVENETYPKWSIITFMFPERNGKPPVKLTWYDGGKRPPLELLEGQKPSSSGSLLIGSKGKLYSPNDYGSNRVLMPVEEFKGYKEPEKSLPRTKDHFGEFAAACKGGPAAMSNFDYAGRLTETILLGNVAMRAGEKVMWNAADMKIENIEGGDALIRRTYRKGFSIHDS